MIIIGSKAGADTNPDWVHNLRANPRAHIEVGTDAYDVTARELPAEERDEAYPKVVAARRVSVITRPRPAASSRCSSCSASKPGWEIALRAVKGTRSRP